MKIKLIEKRDEASGIKSFFWQPEKEVKWIAGQYYYFTLPQMKYPDPRGATRHFTISSSPTEGGVIRITTRIRQESGFKKTLDELPIGAEIEGEGPNGTFFLDESTTSSNVFIAGGIGITPFRSIIKNQIDKQSLPSDGKNLQTPIHLIYSNSTPEEITFRSELEEWPKTHPFLKVDMTISHPEEAKSPWTGITGRVDEPLIRKLVENWKLEIGNCVFWVCGPPAMSDAMTEVLGKMGVRADKLRIEKFTGY